MHYRIVLDNIKLVIVFKKEEKSDFKQENTRQVKTFLMFLSKVLEINFNI